MKTQKIAKTLLSENPIDTEQRTILFEVGVPEAGPAVFMATGIGGHYHSPEDAEAAINDALAHRVPLDVFTLDLDAAVALRDALDEGIRTVMAVKGAA